MNGAIQIIRSSIVLIVGCIFLYMLFAMIQFGSGQTNREKLVVKSIIEKALIECYALEGSYPTDIKYIEKYGVIFDDERYLYYYEWTGGNIKPDISVVER